MSIDIDYVHQKVHEGVVYTACYIVESAANTANMDIRFTTGEREAHAIASYNSEGSARFSTYVGTTYTAAGTLPNGTTCTMFNRNGDSTITATTTIRFAPTVGTLGTKRIYRLLNGGTGGNATGGEGATRNETVIPPNTDILLRLTNLAGTAKTMSIELEWYEVDEG